jgi:hypothetical protein
MALSNEDKKTIEKVVKIISVDSETIKKEDVKNIILNLIKDNDGNKDYLEDDYDKGYYEGCHDGYLDILLQLGYDLDDLNEEHYN